MSDEIVPRESMTERKLALNCHDDRPMWSMPAGVVERIRKELGPNWQLDVVEAPVSSRGDGGSVSVEAIAAAHGAEVYVGAGVPRDIFLAAMPTVRWVHSTTAGISSFLYPELLNSDVVLTNSAGTHAPPMAESVIGMMLYFARGFDFAVAAQGRGAWEQEPFVGADAPIREIDGATVTILGLGGIGRAVERRARALGMRVIGLNRRSTAAERNDALRACDYLVVAVPDTPSTRGMIGAAELALLQRGAVVINLSRGSVLDQRALAHSLTAGRLRGAGLDVFEREPLPADSPLWRLPNVLITPHVSAVSRRFWQRELELLLDNIARYQNGAPLRNVVNKAAGY
jgi:phosphoglycerate dehydrogenase-like enzyme